LLVRSSQSPAVEGITLAVFAVAGVWSATEAERHFGRTDPATS
jgi:hypothetical protein